MDRWAYTDHPERQKRGLSGCLVAFLIGMLFIPILAILAAIDDEVITMSMYAKIHRMH